jgi:hypothetical protein
LRLPQPGGPDPCIYIPQEQGSGGPVIPPGTGLFAIVVIVLFNILIYIYIHTHTYSATDLIENTQRYYEVYFTCLPTCMITMAVKAMCKYYGTVLMQFETTLYMFIF